MKYFFILLFIFSIMYLMPQKYQNFEPYINSEITVAIEGEVLEAKIVKLPKYSTINDALETVELNEEADISSLNPLTVLKDKDVIVIGKKTEMSKISINTANVQQLMQINGIGESKALKIIEYRNQHGLFQKLEDLMKIDGIKEKTYEKIKDLICL